MPFDKDYLWNLLKSAATDHKLFVDMYNPDIKDSQKDYTVLERSVFDSEAQRGDGKVLMRSNEFNIRIHTSKSDKAIELAKRYEAILDANDITFTQYGPTIDPSTKRFSILIIGEYWYGN